LALLYSLNLNSCDFFYEDTLQNSVTSKTNPKTKEDLIEAIKKVVNGITNNYLSKILYTKLVFV